MHAYAAPNGPGGWGPGVSGSMGFEAGMPGHLGDRMPPTLSSSPTPSSPHPGGMGIPFHIQQMQDAQSSMQQQQQQLHYERPMAPYRQQMSQQHAPLQQYTSSGHQAHRDRLAMQEQYALQEQQLLREQQQRGQLPLPEHFISHEQYASRELQARQNQLQHTLQEQHALRRQQTLHEQYTLQDLRGLQQHQALQQQTAFQQESRQQQALQAFHQQVAHPPHHSFYEQPQAPPPPEPPMSQSTGPSNGQPVQPMLMKMITVPVGQPLPEGAIPVGYVPPGQQAGSSQEPAPTPALQYASSPQVDFPAASQFLPGPAEQLPHDHTGKQNRWRIVDPRTGKDVDPRSHRMKITDPRTGKEVIPGSQTPKSPRGASTPRSTTASTPQMELSRTPTPPTPRALRFA